MLQFFVGTSTYQDLKNSYSLPDEIPSKVIIGIAIALLIIIPTLYIYTYFSRSLTKKHSAEEIHKFHHAIRNEIFHLRLKKEQHEASDHSLYYSFVKGRCYTLCEYIHNFLKANYKKDFSVCIKMLDTSKEHNKNTLKVYTLCRAGFKKDDREKNEKSNPNVKLQDERYFINVDANSDFKLILSNKKQYKAVSVFACSNLRILKIIYKILNRPYENSTPKFWKYYKSTIVVPIRIEKTFLESSSNNTYQTIGFLCIDYKKTYFKSVERRINRLYAVFW